MRQPKLSDPGGFHPLIPKLGEGLHCVGLNGGQTM